MIGFHVYATIVSRIHCYKKVRLYMNVLVPIILHVAIHNVIEWPYCTFCKCCFRLAHCRINSFSFRAAKNFLNSPAMSVPWSTQFFFGLFILVIIFENVLTVSFVSFVFIPFASTVLSNKSWRSSKYFTPLLSFANLSIYARSIHQISFLNLAKALTILNLRVACVNLVYYVFECKEPLTFDGESFVALAKLRTEPYAANP